MGTDEINKKIAELKEKLKKVTGKKCEVYSRIVGYYRSTSNWNPGKTEEYRDRRYFKNDKID